MAVIPTLTPLPAGYVAQLSDMQALCNVCTFLMNKPMARVHFTFVSGTQTLPLGAYTPVIFNVKDFDTDGMWSAGSPDRLTIQTPGVYKVRYSVVQSNWVSGNGEAIVTTGAGNPAGSGLVSTWCFSYCYGRSNYGLACGAAGIIGQYLYAGDFVQAGFLGNIASGVGSNSSLALEWAST